MRKIFKGFRRGDIVTGTVHRYNLNTPQLEAKGIIKQVELDPETDACGRQDEPRCTTEWVFNGFQ